MLHEDIQKFYLVFQFTFFVESDDDFDLLDERAGQFSVYDFELTEDQPFDHERPN